MATLGTLYQRMIDPCTSAMLPADQPLAGPGPWGSRGTAFLRTLLGAAIATFGLICADAPAADAANFTCSWNDATANWTTVADWSSCNGTDPNNVGGNTYDVTISQGDPTLTTAVTIGSVTINSPGAWTLSGSGASATLTGTLTNGGTVALGGTAGLTVSNGVTNSGTLDVDANTFDGGGSLTVGGTLANTGAVQIGNGNLGAATTATLGGLTNPSGASFEVFGSASHPATLAFSSGGSGFTSNGGTFVLSDTTPLTLPGPFTNSGTVALDGTAGLTVSSGFTNSATLDVDANTFDGGGSLTVGGTLANTGAVQIGNGNLGAATTATLGGLTNQSTGTLDLFGSASNQATLNIVAASGTTASNAGNLNVREHASLSTAAGVNLSNSGTFNIDTGSGQGASSVTIGGTLSNTAALNV
ncbi:MAG TPA: hypothetical protein VGF39_05350, partial [Stellaceae bacterium]